MNSRDTSNEAFRSILKLELMSVNMTRTNVFWHLNDLVYLNRFSVSRTHTDKESTKRHISRAIELPNIRKRSNMLGHILKHYTPIKCECMK